MQLIIATLSLLFIGTAYGGFIHQAVAPAILNTGSSAQFRSQDNLGNYAFGYNEDHSTGGTFRREQGDVYGTKIGSYGLKDIDGRIRVVNYVADAAGFRANIQTNEPGVAPKDPAATLINKGLAIAPIAVAAAAPLPAYAPVAPLPVAPAYPRPLLAATSFAGPAVYAPSAPVAAAHPGLLAAPALTAGPAAYGSPYGLYPIRR